MPGIIAMNAFPEVGLGNRYRALLSAIGMAKKTNRELVLRWRGANKCYAAVNQLWKDTEAFSVLTAGEWQDYAGPLFKTNQEADIVQCEEPDLRIETWRAFGLEEFGPISQWAHLLKPIDVLQYRIDRFYSRIMKGHKVVSVNPRRHLAAKASLKTTDEWFDQRMREIKEEHPDVMFFLVSDSRAVSARMWHDFPDNLMEQPRTTYDAGTTRVAHVCLVGAHLMAMTPLVLGSYRSTLSDMPIIMNPKCRLETHVDKPAKIDFDNWSL